MKDLSAIVKQVEKQISEAQDLAVLDAVRIQYLGKKGELTEILQSLGKLTPAERPKVGQAVNKAKQAIQELLTARNDLLKKQQLDEKLQSDSVDVTLPGRGQTTGTLHPVMQVRDRVEDIFIAMGFEITEGPEIEDEFYNFEALNTPSYHPARAMQDTFYFADDHLLRSQTSTVQIRYMQKNKPPLRIISPGRVYRRDFDVTHTPMFHQMEGLLVDRDVSLANLKSILLEFLQRFFAKAITIRLRPSYFPFTEPSAEVDMQCVHCEGKGCSICKGSGWLEILGCGMVHPNVFKYVDIDTEEFSGYAFGLGLDRLAMIYYKINDLRLLFENDLKFLGQF
jgi:phenylalanyl-tRNA synthetase alpha chain